MSEGKDPSLNNLKELLALLSEDIGFLKTPNEDHDNWQKWKTCNITVLLITLLNKATSDCSFINLSPILIIFDYTGQQTHSCYVIWNWLPWNPFWWEIMCYNSYQNKYIKLTSTVLIQGVQHCVIHHGKVEVFSILMVPSVSGNVISCNYGHFNCKYSKS